MHATLVLSWVAGGVLLALLVFLTGFRLSSGARLRRRLRRTHSRVVSKAKGPSVQLSVRPPKE